MILSASFYPSFRFVGKDRSLPLKLSSVKIKPRLAQKCKTKVKVCPFASSTMALFIIVMWE